MNYMKYVRIGLLPLLVILVEAVNVLAYHGTRSQIPSKGTPVSGKVIIAIVAVIAIGVWLFVRWWKKML